MARCDELSKCTDSSGGITRLCLSPAMARAHDLVRGWMEAAGMQVRLDAIGNISGTLAGSSDRTLFVGSHLDTVRNAGRYDGALGVLIGIALVQMLREDGVRLPYSVDIVGFADEEGVRFGVPFLGSRVLARTFDPILLTLDDDDGVTLQEAIAAFGLPPNLLAKAPHRAPDDPGEAIGFFEVHIEQGPVLAELDEPIGVVTGIVGQSRARLSLLGEAGHAGTVPMPLRRDALAGAAEFTLEVERTALDTPGLVATVGRLKLAPGAINVIPGSATLTLDLRHAEDGVRIASFEALLARARALARDRDLQLSYRRLGEQAAVRLDQQLGTLLIEAGGGHAPVLTSGAGHDAMIMAEAMPSTMMLLRSPNAVSHSPEEMILESDVARALEVSFSFLRSLGDRYAC